MNQFSRGFRSPNQPSSFEEKYLLFKCWFWSRNFSNVQEIWNPKDFLTIESIQLVLPIQWMMIFTWSMNDIQSIAEKESELRPLCIEDPPALCSTLDEGFWNKCLSRYRRLKTRTKWNIYNKHNNNKQQQLLQSSLPWMTGGRNRKPGLPTRLLASLPWVPVPLGWELQIKIIND